MSMSPMKRGFSSRRWVVSLGSLGGLLVMMVVLMAYVRQPDVLPVEVVEIEGDFRHQDEARLQAAIEPWVSSGFFTIDMHSVRVAVEQLPWISKAKVRRVWPSTLKITISEHQVLAYWNQDALVSLRGKVFRPDVASFPEDLPRLVGVQGRAAEMVERFVQWRAQLADSELRLNTLSMDRRGAWEMRLEHDVLIRVGRRDMPSRIRRFIASLPYLNESQRARIAKVDLRYVNGFAIAWREAGAETEISV
ncbi:MAG TPA: FtsQ-type POTRA domain-containing protein [Chromatiaceae bacterium]|jgi:cell division protein FtsQ|nr:FtsQ-type POTRA domain-containing protein [Chromatiaceae bacterium]HIA09452.1 FtsQ-type POTRA domain-containing protein [Chromatiaceae bacterium]HIB85229.1 FtsQ-type POTRA domain-containing protein [Chromatiaceae bacterium]HIN82147.1 FtsQ-type POTRA domain-containing protein [Chromatiales bacterium]HIO54975.1 FtsQ-type POTRA domain-containing protein [Chromatiales bacterium]